VLLVPTLVLSTYIPLQYSTELRPYSLEMLGVLVVGGLTIFVVQEPCREVTFLLAAFLLLFGVFSRYSFISAIAASVLTLLVFALFANRCLVPAFLTILGSSMFVVLFFTWNVGLLNGALTQASPAYVDDIDLSGSWSLDFIFQTLRQNFLAFPHLATGFAVAVGLTLTVVLTIFIIVGRIRLTSTKETASSFSADDYRTRFGLTTPVMSSIIFILAYEGVAILLSSLGLSPWNATSRWSIGLYSIAILAGYAILSAIESVVKQRFNLSHFSRYKGAITRYVGTVALAVLIGSAVLYQSLASMKRLSEFEHSSYQTPALVLANAHQALGGSAKTGHYFVTSSLWPGIRMLLETDAGARLNLGRAKAAARIESFSGAAEIVDVVSASNFECGDGHGALVIAEAIPQVDYEELTIEVSSQPKKLCQVRALDLGEGLASWYVT